MRHPHSPPVHVRAVLLDGVVDPEAPSSVVTMAADEPRRLSPVPVFVPLPSPVPVPILLLPEPLLPELLVMPSCFPSEVLFCWSSVRAWSASQDRCKHFLRNDESQLFPVQGAGIGEAGIGRPVGESSHLKCFMDSLLEKTSIFLLPSVVNPP